MEAFGTTIVSQTLLFLRNLFSRFEIQLDTDQLDVVLLYGQQRLAVISITGLLRIILTMNAAE